MNKTNTRKALNPAYRKHKPLRKDVTHFTNQLVECIGAVKLSDDNGESEEHIKSHFKDFFSNTFYKANYVNTKERIDLAIYTDVTATSDVGVIIETKKPSNKSEFLTESNLNRKALQELLLYYLRERVDNENNNIKHLIATNGYEWYLFKAEDFYNTFYKNKALLKEYKAFRDGLKDTTKNELFYNEIAKKYIAEAQQDLPFVHLDFTKTNFEKLSDAHLNMLFKIFSDVHLLGHAFGNDSNQLNKAFYNELLHIIGLEEVKVKGKKLISRKSEKSRDYASLLESTIVILEDRDYLSQIKSIENGEDKAFNAGLELCLTWVNRILFLKLLESQLLSYHNKDPKYRFLNAPFITDYDELNDLFFSALAKKEDERHPKYKEKYKDVPYLNSSLFERNTLENEAFEISALNNDKITLYSSTVLKDANGKRLKGKLSTLDYLFQFLDAYDFATDGKEGIEDAQETKSLINASVLGLIFEKINGYKEGSFYTPAYITMYMCRETLRRAVVQKFKEQENDQIETFEDLQSYCNKYFKIDDLKRFNTIIDSLRICDPAVGSGHFLVSALNELIVIKNELGILVDVKGLPLRCDIEIVNDELYVIDDKGALFEYNPNDKGSVRIQHTLFHQKQTLIENCLFGVDINPNSVKICRLRLWIELLKNAYYTKENTLQTLPNIDINIKCGNSLISRFNLDDDLKGAFRNKKNPKLKYTFTDYKNAVAGYKEANSKARKREVLEIIEEVKDNFKSTLDNKFIKNFEDAQYQYNLKNDQINNLKQFGEKISKAEKDRLKSLKKKVEDAYLEKEEIVNNIIFRNAFEWRFEFPEVLADDGSYIGFDVVIGNPPYGLFNKKQNQKVALTADKRSLELLKQKYPEATGGVINAARIFYAFGIKISSGHGFQCMIIPYGVLTDTTSVRLRKHIFSRHSLIKVEAFPERDNTKRRVFEDVKMSTAILLTSSSKTDKNFDIGISYKREISINRAKFKTQDLVDLNPELVQIPLTDTDSFNLLSKIYKTQGLIKLGSITPCLTGEVDMTFGKPALSDNNINRLLVKGAQLDRYVIKTNQSQISQGNIEYIDENIFSEIGSSKKIKDSRNKRIALQGLTGVNEKYRLKATLLNENIYLANSCNYLLKPEQYNLKLLLGWINSSTLNFVFKTRSTSSNVNGYEVDNLPFIDSKFNEEIEYLSNRILNIKSNSIIEVTNELEERIDEIIYKVFDLTKEEIKIIENS